MSFCRFRMFTGWFQAGAPGRQVVLGSGSLNPKPQEPLKGGLKEPKGDFEGGT